MEAFASEGWTDNRTVRTRKPDASDLIITMLTVVGRLYLKTTFVQMSVYLCRTEKVDWPLKLTHSPPQQIITSEQDDRARDHG